MVKSLVLVADYQKVNDVESADNVLKLHDLQLLVLIYFQLALKIK